MLVDLRALARRLSRSERPDPHSRPRPALDGREARCGATSSIFAKCTGKLCPTKSIVLIVPFLTGSHISLLYFGNLASTTSTLNVLPSISAIRWAPPHGIVSNIPRKHRNLQLVRRSSVIHRRGKLSAKSLDSDEYSLILLRKTGPFHSEGDTKRKTFVRKIV